METIRSLSHLRLLLYVLCVTIVGNPAGMRVGRERQRQFVSGHAKAAHSGDCGRRARSWRCSLTRQGGTDNDNPIRKINNKVQVYQYGV